MENSAKRIKELEALLEKAYEKIAQLLERVAELEARVNQNSDNSSKPPSSDAKRKRKPPTEPSGRKRGGQPGHEGKTREMVPLEKVDVTVDVDPEKCEFCGEPLESAPRMEAVIRQFCETPAFRAFIHQINLWAKRCPKCGRKNQAKAPTGTPTGAFGPNLQAKTAMLRGRFRMTKREIVIFHKAFHGVNMSLGSVHACCRAVSNAVADTVHAIHEELKKSPAVHADETGFERLGKDRMWLWIVTDATSEAFRLLAGRGQKGVKDLLGEDYNGIVHRDRWKAYEKLVNATHQLCHSHIRRDFQSILEGPGEAGVQGCMLMLASDKAFTLWHQFERDEITRKSLIARMKPIQTEIMRRLQILKSHPDTSKKVRGTAKDLLRQWSSLWTYVYQDGAVPTNNEAERGIRKAVLWRKVSFGVESEDGARFVERILTLVGTARKRSIDFA